MIMPEKKRGFQLSRANVIGTIHTPGGFAAARKSRLDGVEVRVDTLPKVPSLARLESVPLPVLLTVRRPDEGGSRPWSDAERLAHYLALLPGAAALDLEMRSARKLARVIEGRGRRPLVLSFHDFEGTPSLAKLRAVEARARDAGADVVKIATRTETAAEVARLLTLLDERRGPLAVMGMGKLGRASRLLFARAGSVLNYGWLDRPQVPGQWSAADFQDLLARA